MCGELLKSGVDWRVGLHIATRLYVAPVNTGPWSTQHCLAHPRHRLTAQQPHKPCQHRQSLVTMGVESGSTCDITLNSFLSLLWDAS